MKTFDCNIVLIGFMGTGKSTVARKLGYMHKMEVVEMDEKIARRQGMGIADIFAEHGEEYFRDLETELLRELRARDGLVISCGGGAVLREENVALMKENGRVVLLTATPRTVYERVKGNDRRPILNGNMNEGYIASLMEKRKEKYEAAADIVIATDGKNIWQICEELEREWMRFTAVKP